MLKRKVKKAAALLTAFALITGLLNAAMLTASADTVEWNGKTDLKSGNTYIITKELKVNRDVKIPQNCKLSVNAGGSLKFVKEKKLTVNGEFTVAKNGEAIISGIVNVKAPGTVTVNGTLLASVSSQINVSGILNVNKNGILKTSGIMKMYVGSKFVNKGKTSLLKSGGATVSGGIEVNEDAEFHIHGSANITKSGTLNCAGYMTVGKSGSLKNSGKITLARTADFVRIGIFVNTKQGQLIDKRDTYEYEEMTVSILADEPDAVYYGIDVSVWNEDINWKKVAKSGAVDFVMIRAGRGYVNDENPMKEDDKFREYIEGAQENGLDVGVYFFSYAETVSEIKKEARLLVKILKGYELTYPVALDMELNEKEHAWKKSKKEVTKMVEAFFEIIMDAGYFPMIYSYSTWLRDNLDERILDKYAVWVAHTGVEQTTYSGAYYIWQYSHKGKVSGIKGDVDLNISYRNFPDILRKHRLNGLR